MNLKGKFFKPRIIFMPVVQEYTPRVEDFSEKAQNYANTTHASAASKNMLLNRDMVGHKVHKKIEWTPPDPDHYTEEYYWDQIFAVIIDAEAGTEESITAAEKGLRTLLKGQFKNGFMPNIQNIGPGRKIDLEPFLGFNSNEHSNYTQPPLLALGISKVYYARKNQKDLPKKSAETRAKDFLSEVYEDMKQAYVYLDDNRSVERDHDRRAVIIHPHETGRDSDPTYKKLKPYLIPRKGVDTPKIIDAANIVLDYGQSLWISNRLKRAGEDTDKAHGIFRAVDIMFNAMLVDNLYVAADLAKELSTNESDQYTADAKWFTEYSEDIERKLFEKNWFPDARNGKGAFYSTDRDGNPFVETGVNNISSLLLRGLSEEHVKSQLDMMDTDFDVRYPLPSIGKYSRNFDPNNQQKERLWEGPTWINMNWYLGERGIKQILKNPNLTKDPLIKFRLEAWAIRLAKSSKDLYARNGPKEFYNPLKGDAQRTYRVKRFAWSNLALIQTGVKINYSEHDLEKLVGEYAEYLKALNAELMASYVN